MTKTGLLNGKLNLKGTMKADLPGFILIPLMLVVCAFVLVVLIVAWQQAVPILSQTSNTVGLPVTGTAIAGVQGINQTTYMNIGNILPNQADSWLWFIFLAIMTAMMLSTIVLSANPIGWVLGIFFMPFVIWINMYISNFAHGILMQPILSSAMPFIPKTASILAQLPLYVMLFYGAYIVAISIRVLFFRPDQAGQGGNAEFTNMMLRGRQG